MPLHRFLSILVLTLFSIGPVGAQDAPKIGDVVGKVRFTDIRYSPRTLDDFGKKKAYVLVFTNTTCPIAQRYLPTLQALDKEYRGK
jgi:thiol-disulfide isomerase/thioredoxin